MRPPGETVQQWVDRLAGVWSLLTRRPIGKAPCGCPNKSDGTEPDAHVCTACGHIDTFGDVHEHCAGCGRGALIR